MRTRRAKLSELIGVVMERVENIHDEEILFEAVDGRKWKLWHEQDCCENVSLEDVVGELSDLVGKPILRADEDSNDGGPEGWDKPEYIDSYTWTFYNFATIKGHVTLRWFGESNGCYSERVDFIALEEG